MEGFQPCTDYRSLNSQRVKFAYPLPLVPVALEEQRGAHIFSKLDLCSAYNFIRIRREETNGRLALLLCLGTTNIGSCRTVSPMHLQSFKSHVQQVLNRLQEYHLYLKLEKRELHQSTIQFLGYVITPDGIQMDHTKVEAMKNWPQPLTVKGLQRFLGFANVYRRFISGYSDLSAPLTSLLRKAPKQLSWTLNAVEAFRKLKAAFCSAPALLPPDPMQPFIVEVDASSIGVGAVLSQRRGQLPVLYPCAFFSNCLQLYWIFPC